jgi:hypothetical protein
MKNDIQKEMFPVYGGKCLSCKAVHTGSRNAANVSIMTEEVEMEVWKWLRQQSKRLSCRGFRRTDEAMGQVYQCSWRICQEIDVFFFRLEYHMFYVLYQFVT